MKIGMIMGFVMAAAMAVAAEFGAVSMRDGIGLEPAAGEAVYAKAMAKDATGTIAIKQVHSGLPVYKQVTSEYYTVTNWVEVTENVVTNPVDVWTANVDTITNKVYEIGTNGVWTLTNKVTVVTNLAHSVQQVPVTNRVETFMSRPLTNSVTQTVIDYVPTVTNDFCTITVADHFGQTTLTNKYLAGGKLITATTNAAISVIFKK